VAGSGSPAGDSADVAFFYARFGVAWLAIHAEAPAGLPLPATPGLL